MGSGARRLTVELAGFPICIEVGAETRFALTFCEYYFKGFTVDADAPVASVTILRAASPSPGNQRLLEHRLSAEGLLQRIGQATRLEANTICAGCLDGCLAYHPETRSARMFLGGAADVMYAAVYRLMWMFFAQALGDLSSFFVHAAAIAGSDRGYLFFGDSGAGKTTLAENTKSGNVLADDGPILSRHRGGGCLVHPSPYHQAPVRPGLWRRGPGAAVPAAAFYFLDKNGEHHNRLVPVSRAVPLILQRFIHFWGYLSSGARMAAFDLFSEACHTKPVHYLTVPKGAGAFVRAG